MKNRLERRKSTAFEDQTLVPGLILLYSRPGATYCGCLLFVTGILVWATIAEWFTNDKVTNQIIAYIVIGVVHFSYIFYIKSFHKKEKLKVLNDSIQSEQFNTIPFSDIVNYSPLTFTKWTDTISIGLHSGQEISFTRVKDLNSDNTNDIIVFGETIKANCPIKKLEFSVQ